MYGISVLLFQVCYALDLFLGIIDHLNEEIGKCRATQFSSLRAVQIPVVDGLSCGGVSQTWAQELLCYLMRICMGGSWTGHVCVIGITYEL